MAWGRGGGGSQGFVEEWERKLKNNDPSATSLFVMSFRKLSSSDFQRLCGALADNTTLAEFHCGQALTPADVEALAAAMVKNKGLRYLSVGDKAFGDQGVQTLVPALETNTTLTTLDLENKGLSLGGCAALGELLVKNRALTTLKLARNELTDRDVGALLTPACDEGIDAALQSLDLSQNHLGAGAARALVPVLARADCRVTHLNLAHNTQFSEEAAKTLSEGLAGNTSLVSLCLSGCPIGNAGASAIFTALAANAAVSKKPLTLTLEDCGLGPECCESLVLLLGTLRVGELLLRNNSLGNGGFKKIATALAQEDTGVHTLDLGVTGIDASEDLVQLCGAKSLRNLSLFGNKVGRSVAAAVCDLTGLDNLETLDLSGTELDDSGIELLCDRLRSDSAFLPKLSSLEVGGNAVTDKERWQQASTNAREGLRVVWGERGQRF